MSLREEMARYEQLRGESAEHTPIIKLGAYLDGVDKGIEELEKIKAEIKEWYWQADKQKLSKDACVVDAMTDLFIRTVNKHISELKGESEEE